MQTTTYWVLFQKSSSVFSIVRSSGISSYFKPNTQNVISLVQKRTVYIVCWICSDSTFTCRFRNSWKFSSQKREDLTINLPKMLSLHSPPQSERGKWWGVSETKRITQKGYGVYVVMFRSTVQSTLYLSVCEELDVCTLEILFQLFYLTPKELDMILVYKTCFRWTFFRSSLSSI